jgi:hypothetical protein
MGMVQMKKTFLLVVAFIIALCATELIVRYMIGYPKGTFPPRNFVLDHKLGAKQTIRRRPPYFRYWNVEGGNKVYQRNNHGLPGCDFQIENKTLIGVMGSSFVEALQCDGSQIATTRMQNHLDRAGLTQYQVVNLGISGEDPYCDWFVLHFMQKEMPIPYSILVLESTFEIWLGRHSQPLDFTISPDIHQPIPLTKKNYLGFFRAHSALMNLMAMVFTDDGNTPKGNQDQRTPRTTLQVITPALLDCLQTFQGEYGDHFAVVSIIKSDSLNKQLADYCRENQIQLLTDSKLLTPDRRIKGVGHMNQYGNKALGDLLYEAYRRFFSASPESRVSR